MRKSFRILLTEKCNAKCPNCFNRRIRTNSEISLPNVKKICCALSNLGIKKIKIMGGEPTLHSSFTQCMQLFQDYFEQIILFTNALDSNIRLVHPRSNDIIDYNFNFISPKIDAQKFLLDQPGIRAFEIQINSKTNINFIEEKLTNIINIFNDRTIHLFLTCDCTTNIFDDRDIIISKWNELLKYINSQPILEWHLDHMLPKCFLSNEMLNIPQLKSKKCSIECAGLIDANLNVVFCNQYHDYICSLEQLFNINTTQLDELFQKSLIKKEKQLPNICQQCKAFLEDCNGGCFMHKIVAAINEN